MQAKPLTIAKVWRGWIGPGFFRPDSGQRVIAACCCCAGWRGQKPAADPLVVLDGLAGCGVRALRYGLEAHATESGPMTLTPIACRCCNAISALGGRAAAPSRSKTAGRMRAVEQRFDFVDLDAFGAPMALVPGPLRRCALAASLFSQHRWPLLYWPRPHRSHAALGAAARRSPAVGSWLCV